MDYTIKQLPEQERPREKLEEHGAENMTEVELLSIILRTGTRGKNVKQLSAEIINEHEVSKLADRSLKQLKQFDGISRVKAGQLKALGELARRMQKREREVVKSLQDVKNLCRDMKFMEEEVLRVLNLSSGNEVLGRAEFRGSVDSVAVEPREIFQEALDVSATAVILVHNHPSGKTASTDRDREFTAKIRDLGDELEVELLDHVIVGEGFYSMRKNGEIRVK